MQNSDHLVKEAIALAEIWQNRAAALLEHREKSRSKKLARLLSNPKDKILVTKLIDQSFRSRNPRRIADQIGYLLAEYGIPDFFSPFEKLLVVLFLGLGKYFPDFTVPRIIDKIHKDSSHAIIPAEGKSLDRYLVKRKNEGVHININHLGEAVLGEEAAQARLQMYIRDLKNPAIEYISVKISSIFSQIQPLAFDHSVNTISARLAELYRTAARPYSTKTDGTRVAKFVNLDMESYRDLAITAAAFIQTLDRPEFLHYSAGMALQAYLPDSYRMLKEITAWARRRVDAGGSPIKIRIVKGANMEMEKVEATIFDWPLAPYDDKLDTDANYKRMVDFGMAPENIRAVRLGIASHNLFELAYAYLRAEQNKVLRYFSFEMLEGMADHLRQAIQETGQQVVLYAPVAARQEFNNAIAYLIRRLDENTGSQNFLRHLNRLQAGSRVWRFLAGRFADSVRHTQSAPMTPHRRQDRLSETFAPQTGTFFESEFKNEPNTDWSLTANRQWAEAIGRKWKKAPGEPPIDIPVVVAGEEVFAGRKIRNCTDPAQIEAKVIVARFALANADDVERAVAAAKADAQRWRDTQLRERHLLLSRVAMEIRRSRADLIGAAAADTGKVFTEADIEVSEAVDFTEYYPHSARAFADLDNIRCRGRGVGVVISPWNFPIAIPCGGIAASLAAGNTVIFKPSSDAVLVAWELCQCFWRAGVSKQVLQFLPCTGETTGRRLVGHPDVNFIILTGGTATGLNILKQRPDVFLAAETGGKNAIIVTAMSDRDQSISDITYAAFGNGGQKCSAASLLILEKEVYDDPQFKKQLVDASRSLRTGSAWDFKNKLGPLIRPPRGDLEKALTGLESGESWALQPENIGSHPCMWTPGIKWDVQPGSITHMTEFFGPLLGVIRAANLQHAIEIANQTGYGLTSGLESLDPREQLQWQDRIKAGNLYINRGTTGAVTLRQPFGGMGKSALGAGIKAGGPQYVAQFMNFEETAMPAVGPLQHSYSLLQLAQQWQQKLNWGQFSGIETDMRRTIRAIKSYLYHVEREFSRGIDYFHLRGQDNILRYLPVGKLVVRLHAQDSLFETLARIAAARITGCNLRISIPEDLQSPVTQFLHDKEGRRLVGNCPISREEDDDLIRRIPDIDRIRYAAPDRVSKKVYRAAAENGFYIARSPVMMEGHIELLQYYRQQSICNNYHRYGNLGERALNRE
jgi:RHH-type transcriptional regulator, proline utilization regulon repressor / proline dehydrogenase / delta 1-pyrroline-5-carboxylate dehydrogenase